MDPSESVPHVQARLFTTQSKYNIPSHPLSLQITVTPTELLGLAKSLIAASESFDEEQLKGVQFDFLINGEYLHDSLQAFLERSNLSTENVIEIECVERLKAPEPEDSLQHDDWVASVKANQNWILSGCYDNTVKLWDIASGTVLSTIPGHSAPVKCVAWVNQGGNDKDHQSFFSGSQDGTVLQWQWNPRGNTVDCLSSCHGHAGSVDAVAVSPSTEQFASGSWDKMLKIWSCGIDVEDETSEKPTKKKKSEKAKIITRVPLMTLSGHREGVSSVTWLSDSEVLTSSWDHSIRTWNIEKAAESSCMSGAKAIFSISYSPLNRLTLSASADRHVRLHDHRASEGSLVKCTFTSHTAWVSSVCWSTVNEYLFVSGSYDCSMKLWDTRSPNTSLYDLSGHEEKILSVDWSVPEFMVSGGADNTIKIYRHSS